MAASPEYLALREALLLQAALVDDFLPADLLARVVPAEKAGDILLQAQLMSALHQECTEAGARWQLRPVKRRKVLEDASASGDLPDTEIRAALRGESVYTPDGLERILDNPAEIDTLERTVATLEQAGPAAPGHDQLIALSSKLDRARRDRATDALLGDGFVGREAEIAQLLDVLDHPTRAAPLSTLHIQGLPGVGKTFLLEELSRLCRQRPRIVMVRLDFDQSSLSAGSPEAVFDEISRQIGTAIPEVSAELLALRLKSASRVTRAVTRKGGTRAVGNDHLSRMIDILAERDRQILLLLDTLEVLHGRGDSFLDTVMRTLDQLAAPGRLDISVVSAGRGVIFEPNDGRLRDLMFLEELDAEIMHLILSKRGVPEEAHGRIIEMSGGNPLRLVLVAQALEDGGLDDLDDSDMGEVGTGYLYRAILSRVPVAIRQIAAEGLILPEVGLWELEHIIGPALELEINATRAQELFDLLAMQRWMVREVAPGRLAHTEEVREEILELTYSESPQATRRINARAAQVLAESSPVHALYHRLQLVRADGGLPEIDPVLAQQLHESWLKELPQAARNAVLRTLGRRSQAPEPVGAAPSMPAVSVKRMAQASPKAAETSAADVALSIVGPGTRLGFVDIADAVTPDDGALLDLRNMLEIDELREASGLARLAFAGPLPFEGEAARVAFAYQWRTGRWSMARAMLDLLPEETLDEWTAEDIGLSGLALLEAWAEFRFDAICARLRGGELIEPVENALNLAERSGLYAGALSFAHLCEADLNLNTDFGAMGVLSRYLPQAPQYADEFMAERASAMRGEWGFHVPHDANTLQGEASFAQAMAPLNPYAQPLRDLLADLFDGTHCKSTRDIVALGASLSELGDLFAPHVPISAEVLQSTGPLASGDATLMAMLGLTAELASGYAFFSPIPDLPTIAQAAERWQQATLGRWQYGKTRPPDWQERESDALATQRVEAILGAEDPVARALHMLRIWDDPASPENREGAATLKRRAGRAYARSLAASGIEARLDVLARSKLPSVLHPSLAALAELGVSETRIFTDP